MSDNDLATHAYNKVERALHDVLQLVDADLSAQFRICIMAAAAPLGAAGGLLKAHMKQQGVETTNDYVTRQAFEILRAIMYEDDDAVFAKLKQAVG